MKKRINQLIIILLVVLITACESRNNSTFEANNEPLKVKATEEIIPANQIAPPEVIAISEVEIIPAGKPEVIPYPIKKFKAGKPKAIIAGEPILRIPGQGGFQFPEVLKVTDTTYLVGPPNVFPAELPRYKDINPAGFSSFSTQHGLPTNIVTSFMQDKEGNVWISCLGALMKYDGKSFADYTPSLKLSGFTYNTILQSQYGKFWISSDNGLSLFDGLHLTHFTDDSNEFLNAAWLGDLLEDSEGNIWIPSAGKGLIKFDGETFTHFGKAQGLESDRIAASYKDSKNNLWFGGNHGLSKYDGKSFATYSAEQGLKGFVLSIFEDGEGNLWFGTESNGVYKYDGSTFINYTSNEGLSINNMETLIMDHQGNMWFGGGGGLFKFDGQFFTHYGETQGLTNETIFKGLVLRDGTMWFGSNSGGVNIYNGNQFVHFDISNIRSLTTDKNDNIWVGSFANGAYRLNVNEESVLKYGPKQGLKKGDMHVILNDSKGNLWFDAGEGFAKFDGKNFTYYNTNNGLIANRLYNIKEDKQGNIWISTGVGVSKFDGEFFTNYGAAQGMCKGVWSIYIDKSDIPWCGCQDGSLIKINENSISRFPNFKGLDYGSNYDIEEDAEGNIWFVGIYGLVKYDGESFTKFTSKQGLSNNVLTNILSLKNGEFWISQVNGLSKLSFPAESERSALPLIETFNFNDGILAVSPWMNSIAEDSKGNIWIGGQDKVTFFDPRADISDKSAPKLYLSSVKLFGKDINWIRAFEGSDSSLKLNNKITFREIEFDSVSKWNYIPQGLSLPAKANNVSFSFVGIETRSPKKVKYQYMLEGADEQWGNVTEIGEASYNNLSYGHYIFKVKAASPQGVWSDEISYAFEIRPHWYQTWYAYILYLILALGILRAYILYRARILTRENKVLEEKVKHRTNQLETSLNNLKSTQAQLIQSEKMASLGELTAGIAHEIQNPLNFVNNFSEVSGELVDEMNEELEKGDIEEAKFIGKDLKDNLSKINLHGKRADAIVKGMLEHSKKGSGQKEPTDLNALADEFLRLSYQSFLAKVPDFQGVPIAIGIKTDFDPDLPKVSVIPQDIGKVILNLVNNAFYAVNEKAKSGNLNPDYEPIVTVCSKKTENGVELSVKDNGPGIPDSIKEKIFQPFFTTKPTGSGTGLGLSLSYDIVKAHGGELRVESVREEGTVFILTLPR